jgi:hypothetical protein
MTYLAEQIVRHRMAKPSTPLGAKPIKVGVRGTKKNENCLQSGSGSRIDAKKGAKGAELEGWDG